MVTVFSNVTTRFGNGDTSMSLTVVGGVQSEIFQGIAPGPSSSRKSPLRDRAPERRGCSIHLIVRPFQRRPTRHHNSYGPRWHHNRAWTEMERHDHIGRFYSIPPQYTVKFYGR
jgi:hypothetical protein